MLFDEVFGRTSAKESNAIAISSLTVAMPRVSASWVHIWRHIIFVRLFCMKLLNNINIEFRGCTPQLDSVCPY